MNDSSHVPGVTVIYLTKFNFEKQSVCSALYCVNCTSEICFFSFQVDKTEKY